MRTSPTNTIIPEPETDVPPTEPIPEPDPTHSPVLPEPTPLVPEPTPIDRRHARAPRPARPEPTYDDLYEEARRRRLPGRSAMTKVELARALGH